MLTSKDIELKPLKLHWIKRGACPDDFCAHSPVCVKFGTKILMGPDDGDWTVSAAALHLLRALRCNHTAEELVGEQLIPCCGHFMYPTEKGIVEILGCNHGVDWEVRHRDGVVECRFTQLEGEPIVEVSFITWTLIVCEFADAVENFYQQSVPRVINDDIRRRAFELMWREWRQLRDTAFPRRSWDLRITSAS